MFGHFGVRLETHWVRIPPKHSSEKLQGEWAGGLVWRSSEMDMQTRVSGQEVKAVLMCPGSCTGWQAGPGWHMQSRQAEALTRFQNIQ